MANIFTNLNLTADSNFFITQKINSIGYVGENTVTRLNIEVPEITEGANYELETENSAGEKNVALLSVDVENNNLYLDFTARMLTVNDLIMMQLRVTYTDNSIKKSNRFAMKIAKSISATDHYEEYAVSIFDQLVQECRDIIEGAESYAVRAETAAVNAEAYEQSASASASTASTASETAQTASTAAVNAAASAESASTSAHTSAETATTAAASASTSASTAQTSAQTAQSVSVTAQSASEAAQTASTAATSAQTAAETAANTATTAASNASASATSASTSASNAATSETNASNSATAAATSATNAAASASSASTSAANANTSATNAANSAVAAAASATNAHNSEINASNSETNASTSATEAAASAESIAASVAQINENTYRINDLEAIIAGYQQADLPTGAIASVTDGTALLMPSLKVGIEPVQDLHGYDHPWADGAGKNKLQVVATTQTIRGVTITVNDDGTIIINGTSTSIIWFTVSNNVALSGQYIMNGCPSGGNASTGYSLQIKGTNGVTRIDVGKGINYENDGTPRPLYIRLSESVTYNNVVFKPMIRLATETDATFEPYSNICPISGWTTANISVSPTTSVEDGTTYTIQFRDGDNPLTVYGGTLDVTSGELVVNRYKGVLAPATSSIVVSSAKQCIFPTPAVANGYLLAVTKLMCDKLVPSNYSATNDNHIMFSNASLFSIVLSNEVGTTKEAWAQWLTDMQISVCYELATPITYHLTPTQVRTLVGNNNIWANTGNIIEGKYFKSLS